MPGTINPTPPTAPVGAVMVDRVGIDTGGHIWFFGSKTWQYVADYVFPAPGSAEVPPTTP